MIQVSQLMKEAREWVGTPFHHQASVKGVGADCVGSIKGIIHNIGVDVSSIPTNYPRRPDGSILPFLENSDLVTKVDTPELVVGYIALFRVYREPQHFGLISYSAKSVTLIHAVQPYGFVEVPFDDTWKSRLVSLWKFNFVEYEA